jgi:DNA-binding beta-propeller fold protein YncE
MAARFTFMRSPTVRATPQHKRKGEVTMRTATILTCAALACGAAAAPTAETSADAIPAGTIWVTERSPGASTVAAIDAATGTVRGWVGVGDIPIGVTLPNGTGKVYSSDEGRDQMSVLDRDTVTVLRTIPMGAGSRPHHLMASQNGRYIFVGEYGSNRVGIVDTTLDRNILDYPASLSQSAKTHAVWITPDGHDLYATNEAVLADGTGTFSKIDVHTGNLIWEQPVGNRPSEVLVCDNVAFVSVRNEHKIKVFDVGSGTPLYLGQAEANFMPDTLSLTPDRRTLIVGLRGSPARMAFIDPHTLSTTYLALPGTTTGHQALSPNGRFTFMAVESPGQVAVIDNESRTLVVTYPYPKGMLRPHGVFFEPGHAGRRAD